MLRTRRWALIWNVLRLIMAAAVAAAVIAQLVASVTRTAEAGDDVATVVANFFSFFTILSNAGSVVVLTWAAMWFFARGRRLDETDPVSAVDPRGLAIALASVTTYMIITGVVYNLLLRGIELPLASRPIPWSNETLHLIAPLFLVLDLLVGALRRALPWKTIGIVLVFPIVWVVYTLVRGPLVVNPVNGDPFWYPYPFLNPNNFDNGYGTVAIYIAGIAAAIVGVACLVVWVGRRRGRAAHDLTA